MLGNITQEYQMLLIEIMNQINQTEEKAEKLRIQLCRKSNFNPYSAFKKLDENKSIITVNSLSNFLKDNEMMTQDCLLVFKQLTNKDTLNYQEFLSLILTKSETQLREVTAMKSPLVSELEKSTESILAQLFYLEHQEAHNLERLKIRLFKQYSPQELFECVDSLNNNVISFKDIDRFYRRNGLLIYEEELYRFFIRVDVERSGFININDFKRILTPINDPESIQSQPLFARKQSQAGQIVMSNNIRQSTSPQCSQHNSQIQNSSKQCLIKSSNKENSTIETDVSEKLQYEQYLNSEHLFLDFLTEIMKVEQLLEETKIYLASQTDFNVMDTFHFIDLKSQGKVTYSELKKFITNLGLKNVNTKLIFKYYDKDNDGYMRYSDFSDFLNPLTPIQYKKQPKNNSLTYTINQLFSVQTISLLKQVLCLWFTNEEIITERLDKIVNRINLLEIFQQIDQFKKGSFNKQDLQRYLQKYDISEDSKLLFKRFGRNKKDVTYEEFLKNLNLY